MTLGSGGRDCSFEVLVDSGVRDRFFSQLSAHTLYARGTGGCERNLLVVANVKIALSVQSTKLDCTISASWARSVQSKKLDELDLLFLFMNVYCVFGFCAGSH